MFTIAIVNEKGGTGKTTTAVNLAAALGERGLKVLLVDLDGQAASSRWLGIEDNASFADALWRGSGLEPLPEVIPGVALAPGHGKLDAVAHDLRPTQGGQLRKLLMETQGFEYVVIDCPPSLGNRLIGNALLAASHAIVPVETSILALDGLKILLTTLEDVREGFGHNIILAGVLACRFDSRTKLSHLVLEELKRALPGKVFNTVIRENVRMRECPASGKSILAYASDCHAAADYRALAEEVVGVLSSSTGRLDGSAGGEPTAAAADSWKEIGQLLNQATKKIRSVVLVEENHPTEPQQAAPSAAVEGSEGEQLLRELEAVCAPADPAPPTVVEQAPSACEAISASLPPQAPGEAATAEQPAIVETPMETIVAIPQPPMEVAAEVGGSVEPIAVAADVPLVEPSTDNAGAMEVGQIADIAAMLGEQDAGGAVDQKFPALEALLRNKTAPGQRNNDPATHETHDDKKRSSWLRILERVGGMK